MTPTVPIENSGQVGMLVASGLCIVIPSILVGLRLVSKRRGTGRLDWSDFCITAALFFNMGMQIDNWVMVFKGGFGFHVSEVAARFGGDTLRVFYQSIYAFPLLWNATIGLSKLSIILMYTSLMPIDSMVLAGQIIGGTIVLWNTASFMAGVFICSPIAYNWDQSIPGGRCGNQPLYYFALGVINLLAEFVIIALPMPFLYRLRLPRRKKLFCAAMFSIAFITAAITIYRQTMLPSLDFTDMTYDGLLATLLSGLEPAVAITLACVPLLKNLHRQPLHEVGGFRYSENSSNNAQSGTRCRQIRDLEDDSSEIQLRPVDGKQDVSITAEPRSSSAAGHADIIRVERKWEVTKSD